MIDISAMARERSSASGHELSEWEAVINYGSLLESVGQLTDGEFLRLAKECTSPETYKNVVNAFEQHAISSPDGLPGFDLVANEIDASNFSMQDWFSGINWMMKWLEFHKQSAEFEKMVGYIKCCAMSLEASGGGSLAETVKEMLETEGFEAAQG